MSGEESQGMTRRALLRRSGAAAVGTAGAGTVGYRYGVGGAEAAVCGGICIGAAVAGGIAVGAGVGYLAGSGGSGPDRSDVENALMAEDHLELYNRAREINDVREENVLSSMETEANLLRHVARENAVFAIFEDAASGLDRSDAEESASTEISKVYHTPQKRLATRLSGYFDGIITSIYDKLNQYKMTTDGGNFASSRLEYFQKETIDAQGVNGLIPHTTLYTGPNNHRFTVDDSNTDGADGNELWITEFNPSEYDQDPEEYDLSTVDGHQRVIRVQNYWDLWSLIEDEHSAMQAEIESLLDTHYQSIKDGDVAMQEFLAPSSMIDTASEASDWQEAALLLNAMNVPKGTEPVVVEIDTSELAEVDADTAELEGMIGWSLAGSSDSGLPVGTEIDPADWPGNIYMATQWEDQESGEMTGDVLELVEPFTIAGTQNGSSVLTFEERGVIEPDTSPEDAMDIFRDNRESERTARETTVEVIVPDNGGFWAGMPSFGGGSLLKTAGALVGGIGTLGLALGGAYLVSRD